MKKSKTLRLVSLGTVVLLGGWYGTSLPICRRLMQTHEQGLSEYWEL